VADTEDKKNELESFIYELRDKIDDQYAAFSNDAEKAKVHAKCEEVQVCRSNIYDSN
jgi:heat shock protein 4